MNVISFKHFIECGIINLTLGNEFLEVVFVEDHLDISSWSRDVLSFLKNECHIRRLISSLLLARFNFSRIAIAFLSSLDKEFDLYFPFCPCYNRKLPWSAGATEYTECISAEG